nr:hypothetical protein [Tanacetum cinerariifolium]
KSTSLVESDIQTNAKMADNRTMAQMLQAPIEGYEDVIVVLPINANNFELKQTLINLVQSNQITGWQDPHNHLRFFNKVTSTFRHPEVPNTTVKLLLFPFSLEGEARIWLDKEPPRSILTWEDLVSKFINQFFPLPKQQLHQLDTFYNALNPNDQDALDSAAGGNFLDKIPRECLSIIESKSKVRYSRSQIPDVRANANANLSSSSQSNSFDLQQSHKFHQSKMSFHQALNLIFELDEAAVGCTQDILRKIDCLDWLSEIPWVIPTFIVIEEYHDIVAKFFSPSQWKELSKETSSKILPCGDGSCLKTFKPIASLIA